MDTYNVVCRLAAGSLLFLCGLGCEPKSQTTGTQPTEPTSKPPAPVVAAPVESPPKATSKPKPPEWVILREPIKKETDASIDSHWTGANRLEITTVNVHKITLDLRKLPSDAPRKGPWNLQIDGQGIQIFGSHGKVMEVVRSPNGDWAVDIDSQRDHS